MLFWYKDLAALEVLDFASLEVLFWPNVFDSVAVVLDKLEEVMSLFEENCLVIVTSFAFKIIFCSDIFPVEL